jgi:hypothetical protein
MRVIRLVTAIAIGLGLAACANGSADQARTVMPAAAPTAEEKRENVKLVQLPERPPAKGLAAIKDTIGKHMGELNEKHKMKIMMLGVGADHIWMQVRNGEDFEKSFSEEQLHEIRKSVFELVGSEFMLKLGVQECCNQPNLSGKITQIKGNQVLVVNEDKKNGSSDDPEATYVTLAEGAKVVMAESHEAVAIDQLIVGQYVKVWTTGLMMQSYPGQTSGLRIEVVGEGEEAALKVKSSAVSDAKVDSLEINVETEHVEQSIEEPRE